VVVMPNFILAKRVYLSHASPFLSRSFPAKEGRTHKEKIGYNKKCQ